MTTATQAAAFRSILLLAADNWAQLRRCDVYRVLAAARDAGCLMEFADELMSERQDLSGEAYECVCELA